MNLNRIKKIYMIGIKGVGMTMLAQYFAKNGADVTGSDTKEKYMTDEVLQKTGIKYFEDFNPKNIPNDADLIIYSSAYSSKNNIEMQVAEKGKIKLLSYAQVLGEIFNERFGIAVVGSHGKTTTTAWLGFVMDKAGLNPNVLVGANVPQFGGNTLVGSSDYFLIEADEYQNKLQFYNPKAVILNNIDYDHPDFFPTVESYTQAFIEFISKLSKKGLLVANFDDPIISKIAYVNTKAKVIGYAIENTNADFVAHDLRKHAGKQYFKVKMADESGEMEIGDFSIALSGRHNIYNALAVIAAAIELGVELSDIRKYLEDFQGTERRMQILGEYNGAIIIDDYAHHPTEIKSTLSGVRDLYPKKRLIVVFHPHTFTRTKALLDDFARSFSEADELIVIDIYGSAREIQGGISSSDLVEKIKSTNKAAKVQYIPTMEEAENYLKKHISSDSIVILMGAGDIFRIGQNLLKA